MKIIFIIFCLLLLSITLFNTSLLGAITGKHNEKLLDLSTGSSVKDSNYVFEGFEETTFPPFGWENPGDHWARFTTNAYEGQGYARCSWFHNADAILISPRLFIDGADSISFFWRNDNLYEAKETDVITGDTLYIEISNTYLDPEPIWECVGILSASTPMTNYEEVSFSIPDTYIGNDAKLRWRHHSEVNNESRGVGLDNIIMPAPYLPVNFKVEPSYVSDHIGPGNSIDFQYYVTNLGVQTDRYFIVVQDSSAIRDNKRNITNLEADDGGWPATVNVHYLDLAPCATGSFSLTIEIPENAEIDDSQLNPILVYSREENALSHQVLALATCHPRDPYEPNDHLTDATPADYDFVSNGAQIYYDPYYKDEDIDIYTIDCQEGDIMYCAFELQPDETEFNGAIKLVDADSTELAYANEWGAGGSEYLQYRVLSDGTYYWILGKWDNVLEGKASGKTQTKGENTTYYTVTFDLIPPPEIEVTPTTLCFGIIYGSGEIAEDELYISNIATDPQAEALEWDIELEFPDIDLLYEAGIEEEHILRDTSWLSVSPTSGSINPGNTQEVIVTCDASSGLDPGTYTADIIVHNNALLYGASDITIPVSLNYNYEAAGLLGYVTYGGNPVPGVLVKAGNYETYTDENGYYEFDSIVVGTYKVIFYKEGFIEQCVYYVTLSVNWIVVLDIELLFDGPPPENFTATAGYGCIYLDWDPPQTGGGGGNTQVDYILDDGSYENGWSIDPGYNAWLGNQFPVIDGGELISFEVYGDENVAAGNETVTIDVFDSERNYVGSSDPFIIPSGDCVTVSASNIPFTGEFYAMIHWDDLPTPTNFIGFDENGPYANAGYDWFYDGTLWKLVHVASGTNPGVFMLRATAMVRGRNIELAYDTYKLGKEPEVYFRPVDNSAFEKGQSVLENVFSQSGHSFDTGSRGISHYTFNGDNELDFKLSEDLTLLGYNLYRQDIGLMYYFDDPNITSFTDDIVAYGEEYTYSLTAVYNFGESIPVTATATPYPPPGGYHEPFDQNWTQTGWVQEPPDGNWMWSPGYAYLSWSPSVPNYDMSLISPEISLIGVVWDLVVKMYINDYSSDTGEIMEIWVIHDTGETLIFEWDLDSNDDWGVPGGSNWSYDMSQFTGQTIQLKFRSCGGDTYNFNYWYIYDVLINLSWIPPDYGALEGIVIDSDCDPIEGVRVTADNADYNPVYTDEFGHYMISPMITGLYDVQFYKDGYSEAWYYDVEIDSGDTTVLDVMFGNPTMEIYPTSLNVTLPPGGSTTRTITVTNNGTAQLDWYINYADKTNTLNQIEKLQTRETSWSTTAEVDPNPDTYNPPSSDDIWDIMFSYDVDTPTGGLGIAGAEFGNGYFLVSEWGYLSKYVFKFDSEGNYISSWEPTWITETGGLRDMTFDGEYFYGSNASNTIYQYDEDGNLYGTFTSPVAVRAIAYDSFYDAFWVNNWSEDLKLIDRSGTVINTIYSPPSMYGSAYDNVSDGGPYLWIFTGTSSGSGCQIEQYDLNTLTLTGVIHSVSGDFGAGYIAGGLFTSGDIIPGTWVLGGVTQGTPNILFGYELCQYIPQPHIIIDPTSGTVEPFGGTQDVTFYFYAQNAPPGTIISGDVIFQSNQGIPPVTVSISFIIGNPEYGTLTGTISHGNPVANAEVHAYNGSNSYVTYTNSSGFYFIEEMIPGYYTVEITADGYNTYTTPDVPIIADQTTILNIILTAPIMVVYPDSITVTVPPGGTTTEYFTICNIGDGPLDFSIDIYDYGKTLTDYSNCSNNAAVSIRNNILPAQGDNGSIKADSTKDEIVLHYDGENLTAVGISSGGTFIAAARFTPDELGTYYNDYSITGAQIFIDDPVSSAILKVWEGGSYGDPGSEIYSQSITSQITLGWNSIDLLLAISLLPDNEYWIGYEITNATGDYPLGIDAGPAIAGKGDWIYLNGEWNEFSTYGYNNNWNIRMIINSGSPPWIDVSPVSGTIPAGSSIDIAITFYATYCTVGDIKTADIVITSSPDVGVVTIPVVMYVDYYSHDETPITETKLYPNFPNPILNTTTFNFSLKERSHVKLSVYNIKGQLVEILLDEELDPSSSHHVGWNGTVKGRKLANGIYFYKLETDKETFLNKMILMR